jgi:hypothetical protein
VWDEVLEYRVWCHPERGAEDLEDGSDHHYTFATYTQAAAFSASTAGAEAPLALILQREYIAEPRPGEYHHVRKERVTEWPVEFLRRPEPPALSRISCLSTRHRIGWTSCAVLSPESHVRRSRHTQSNLHNSSPTPP